MLSDIFSSEIFEPENRKPARKRNADPFRIDSARSPSDKADAPAQDFEDIPLMPPAAEDNQVYMDKDGVIHRRGA